MCSSLTCDSESIAVTDTVKYLGIHIVSGFQFTRHLSIAEDIAKRRLKFFIEYLAILLCIFCRNSFNVSV